MGTLCGLFGGASVGGEPKVLHRLDVREARAEIAGTQYGRFRAAGAWGDSVAFVRIEREAPFDARWSDGTLVVRMADDERTQRLAELGIDKLPKRIIWGPQAGTLAIASASTTWVIDAGTLKMLGISQVSAIAWGAGEMASIVFAMNYQPNADSPVGNSSVFATDFRDASTSCVAVLESIWVEWAVWSPTMVPSTEGIALPKTAYTPDVHVPRAIVSEKPPAEGPKAEPTQMDFVTVDPRSIERLGRYGGTLMIRLRSVDLGLAMRVLSAAAPDLYWLDTPKDEEGEWQIPNEVAGPTPSSEGPYVIIDANDTDQELLMRIPHIIERHARRLGVAVILEADYPPPDD